MPTIRRTPLRGAVLPAIVLALPLAARAQPGAAPPGRQEEVAELRKRVELLERQVRELTLLLANRSRQPAEPARPAGRLDPRQVRELVEACTEAARADARTGWPLADDLRVQVYGKIKLDAAYDSERTSAGNFARWVESTEDRSHDGQYNMTANETRLGLRFTGPKSDTLHTAGRVEVDFYGGGGENKPNPMLRHAYLTLDWPKRGFQLLAGQTSDVVSPLVPETLNYPVCWWAGNIGYRRPQLRATQSVALSPDVELKLQAALARTLGHDGPFDPGDTGEDAGFPTVQGRAAVTFPLLGRKATVGVSGHFGQEEYDTDATGRHVDVYSWSGNVDAVLPITEWLRLKGEFFLGQDLDAYLGGIGQGIDVNGGSVTELRSVGGWVAAGLGPWKQWRFNVGFSGERLDAGDLTSAGARTGNRAIFGNAIYQLNPNASIGVEASHWHTDYKGRNDGDSLRVQTSFIYGF